MVCGGIGKFLSDDVRSITRKERGDRRLELCVGALDVFLVVVLIAVGAVVGERGVGAKAVLIDIECHILCELSVT